jgi:hypothetical protein
MLTTRQVLIGLTSAFVRALGVHGDDGVQRWVVSLNLRQVRLQHFCG